MGRYGCDNIKKYYSIGFDKDEKKQIETAFKEWQGPPFFRKYTSFIKHLVIISLDLKQENKRLKNILESISRNDEIARAASGGQSEETTWTGYFRDVKRVGNTIYPVWGVRGKE
jgi:hypothetical protein